MACKGYNSPASSLTLSFILKKHWLPHIIPRRHSLVASTSSWFVVAQISLLYNNCTSLLPVHALCSIRPYSYRVDSTLLARKSCWSTAYVPGICEALPAALAAARLLASLGLGAALPFAALRLVLLLGSQQAEPLRFRQAARDAALNFLGPIGRALVAGARVLHRAVAGMLGRCGARRGGGGVEGGQEGVSLARSPSRPELLRREEGSGERTPPRGGGSPLAGAGGPGTALQMVQRGGAQIVSRGGGASAAVGGDGIV